MPSSCCAVGASFFSADTAARGYHAWVQLKTSPPAASAAAVSAAAADGGSCCCCAGVLLGTVASACCLPSSKEPSSAAKKAQNSKQHTYAHAYETCTMQSKATAATPTPTTTPAAVLQRRRLPRRRHRFSVLAPNIFDGLTPWRWCQRFCGKTLYVWTCIPVP